MDGDDAVKDAPMRCDEAGAALNDWIDGLLDEERLRAMEEHLKGCEGCAREAARLRRLVGLLRGLPGETVPVDLAARVKAGGLPGMWRYAGVLASAAAALLIAVVLAFAWRYPVESDGPARPGSGTVGEEPVASVPKERREEAKVAAAPGGAEVAGPEAFGEREKAHSGRKPQEPPVATVAERRRGGGEEADGPARPAVCERARNEFGRGAAPGAADGTAERGGSPGADDGGAAARLADRLEEWKEKLQAGWDVGELRRVGGTGCLHAAERPLSTGDAALERYGFLLSGGELERAMFLINRLAEAESRLVKEGTTRAADVVVLTVRTDTRGAATLRSVLEVAAERSAAEEERRLFILYVGPLDSGR